MIMNGVGGGFTAGECYRSCGGISIGYFSISELPLNQDWRINERHTMPANKSMNPRKVIYKD